MYTYTKGANQMGYSSNLQLEVLELAHCGLDATEIAEKLHVALDEIEWILEADSDADLDGQPTELEEWMDFDPDC
jgi:orotate phosphoribosyltransferase-like protein